ncbi:MAG: TIGR02449 family protein [Gammaproteobacteria bacterium]
MKPDVTGFHDLITVTRIHRKISSISGSVMIHSDSPQTAEIKLLEEKLDDLIRLYHAVKEENRSLKAKQEELVREKAKLLEKTSQVKTRVEAMITRLKAMEHGS